MLVLAGASSTTTALKGAMPSPLLRRLLRRGFETVPLALLIQMTTLYTPGGSIMIVASTCDSWDTCDSWEERGEDQSRLCFQGYSKLRMVVAVC